ncbi:MAG TPA: YtxH domain-containing protein [Acidimicrobiales bacterium]|nr:YtxH domain-containing protein [Acidimicrobiales bacterium]
MRFRAGLVVGFAAGYYLGTAAGRERHEQIKATIRKAKRSDAYDTVTDKAQAVVDLGVERAKDLVDSKTGGSNGNGSGPKFEVPKTDPPVRP